MNDDIFKGQWQQLKGQIKEKWGKLTDDDIDRIGGQKDQLLGRIQERYGYAKEDASREIDDFFTQKPRTYGAGS